MIWDRAYTSLQMHMLAIYSAVFSCNRLSNLWLLCCCVAIIPCDCSCSQVWHKICLRIFGQDNYKLLASCLHRDIMTEIAFSWNTVLFVVDTGTGWCNCDAWTIHTVFPWVLWYCQDKDKLYHSWDEHALLLIRGGLANKCAFVYIFMSNLAGLLLTCQAWLHVSLPHMMQQRGHKNLRLSSS